MSIFNDKALKGVADAVSKIMDEELKGNQHKIDANKNGKVDAHDFKLLRAKKGMKEAAEKMATKDHDQDGKIETGKAEFLGSRIRAAKAAGKLKEETDLDEAFPSVDDAKKRMDAGKTSTGSVTKTKTGLIHKRDYKDDADDTPSRATKGYGARQNATSRGKSMGTSGGRKAGAKKTNPNFNEKDYQEGGAKHTGKKYKTESPSRKKTVVKHYEYLGKKMSESYTFTEMLELYNEHGLEVISKIVPQTVKFGDTEVEVIDANIVNGAVAVQVEEGVMSAVKGAVGVVKDVISKERAYQAQKQMSTGNTLKKLRKEESLSEEPDNETFTKEVEAQKEKNAGRGKKAEVAKASVQAVKQEEVEQIDEVSKKTLGSYIKAASHDVAAKGAFTRHFADKSRAETAAQRPDLARLTMKKADKMQDAGMKRRANMAKAVDRLTKKD